MAGLTGTNISSTYKSLLRVANDTGIDATLRQLEDGLGTDVPIEIATETLRISPPTTDSAGFCVFTDKDNNTILSIDSSNDRVGIGVTAPSNTLHVSHTAADGNNGIMIVNEASTIADTNLLGGIGFDGGDGNIPSSVLEASAFIAAYAAEDHDAADKGADLVFGCSKINDDDDTASHEYMRILDSGNVGIGTTAPAGKLHIFQETNLGSSAGDTQELLRLEGDSAHNDRLLTSMIRLRTESDGNDWHTAQWRMQRYVDSTYMSWIGFGEVKDGTAGGNYGLAFGTGSDTNEPENVTQKMVINSAGRVGIGTSTPTALLTVAVDGNPEIMFDRNDTQIDSGNEIGRLSWGGLDDTAAGTSEVGAFIQCSAAENWNADTCHGTNMVFATTFANLGTTEPAERVRIRHDGHVGINEDTPDTVLHVSDAVADIVTIERTGTGNDNCSLLFKNSGGIMYCGVDGSAGDFIISDDTDKSSKPYFVVTNTGGVGIGDAAPEGMLCVNQAAGTGEIMTFKSSSVNHGMTSATETDTFGRILKTNSGDGGLFISGLAESGTQDALKLSGYTTAEQTTRSTSALGFVNILGGKKDGTTAGVASANMNLVSIRNYNLTKFIFDSDGDAHCDGTSGWTDYSDSRLKTDIETIPYGLAEVLQFQPKRFKKASGSFDESGNVVLEDNAKVSIGFIAQDIKTLIPEMVKDIDTTSSFYSMDNSKLVAVLVKAIQELSTKVTALENA